MSKVRNLPELINMSLDDMLYAVEASAGPNGGRKITALSLRTFILDPASVKISYESNADTNAYTDAEKTKLAGIEPGATTDQNAAEVPYDNSDSGLLAINVQEAIDEIATQSDFRSHKVAGRILHYNGGSAAFDGVFYGLTGNDILLNPNVTDGYVYLDIDGIIKQSGSFTAPPPYSMAIARFTTDASQITALSDERVRNNQNLIRGLISDVTSMNAGNAAIAGATFRLADAGHQHAVITGTPVLITPDQANAEGVSTDLARADHVHNIPTGTPSSLDAANSNTQGSSAAFARQDHLHAILTGIVIGQTPDQANAAGSSANLARADHTHNIPTAAATGLNATSTNTQGAATTFSRADHTHAILSGIVIGQTPDQANAAGSSTAFARADHTHNIPTAIAVDVSSANAQGAAATFSRADHVHRGVRSLKAGLAGTQRFGDLSLVSGNGTVVTDDGSGNFTIDTSAGPNELLVTQGAGLTVNYTAGKARINGTVYNLSASSFAVAANATNGRIYVDVDGIVKSTTATSSPPNSVPLAIFSSNVSSITALSDHRSFLNVNLTFGLAGDIQPLAPDAAATPGSSNKYADAGHTHSIPTAAAVTISATTTNTQGAAATFARADHTHAILTGIVIGQAPDQANAAGSSANLARADHVHNIPTAAPSTLNATNANTQGAAATFARADHLHAISTGIVIGQTPDQANAAGSSANLARADHTHNIPTAAAVSISTSTANAQGAAATFARADHTHAVSITNQSVNATGDTTTASGTDVLIASMTITPAAGTYMVIFDTSVNSSANGIARMFISLYSGGVQVTGTEKTIGISGGANVPVTCSCITTVNGSQAIEARWRAAAGTQTAHERILNIMKIG